MTMTTEQVAALNIGDTFYALGVKYHIGSSLHPPRTRALNFDLPTWGRVGSRALRS